MMVQLLGFDDWPPTVSARSRSCSKLHQEATILESSYQAGARIVGDALLARLQTS